MFVLCLVLLLHFPAVTQTLPPVANPKPNVLSIWNFGRMGRCVLNYNPFVSERMIMNLYSYSLPLGAFLVVRIQKLQARRNKIIESQKLQAIEKTPKAATETMHHPSCVIVIIWYVTYRSSTTTGAGVALEAAMIQSMNLTSWWALSSILCNESVSACRCCMLHDKCYDAAVENKICFGTAWEYIARYKWDCVNGTAICEREWYYLSYYIQPDADRGPGRARRAAAMLRARSTEWFRALADASKILYSK